MKKTAWIVCLYATLVFVGGLIGHIRSESKASLISGTIFGLLLFLSSFFMFKKKIYGYFSAFFLALILEGFFTWRFAKTLKFFPGGLLSLISLFVIIVVACKIGRRLRTAR
ncbi:MAG: TMEM14 family protein [Verrucomicrobia bacterium]|nr:TMEM14 family protein [Verrucomicrobiota bacterium]